MIIVWELHQNIAVHSIMLLGHRNMPDFDNNDILEAAALDGTFDS